MKFLKVLISDIRAYLAIVALIINSVINDLCGSYLVNLLLIIVLLFLYAIINYLLERKNDRKNTGFFFTLDREEDADRNKLFQDLRNSAESDVVIMGIGMSNISSNIPTLRKEMLKGKNVKLLMIEPNYINADTGIKELLLNSIDERESYIQQIHNSKTEIMQFISELQRKDYPKSSIELRTYQSVIPLNMTMIDNSRIIVEFCLPYTDERIMGEFSKKKSTAIFEKSKLSLINIWDNAEPIIKFPNSKRYE